MALDLENTPLVRPQYRNAPTILQLCPCDHPRRYAIALALARTDDGNRIFGVDANGELFVLGAK